MDVQVEEQLSEPVKRAWRKLQNNLEQATERHYQEQRMLVTSFMNDMLRMEKRNQEKERKSLARSCISERATSYGEMSRSDTSAADRFSGNARTPSFKRATTKDESIFKSEQPSPPTDRLRCQKTQALQGKLVVAASGGSEFTESEVQFEKEWLSKLTRQFVHQVGSFKRSTEWIKAKALARTDTELLMNPFSIFYDWYASLEEPVREGHLAGIVQGRLFELFCCTLICINSFATWSLVNDALAEAASGATEYGRALAMVNFLFVIWYWVELGLKLCVHGYYFLANEDLGWNLFDTGLVLVSTVEVMMTLASRFTLSSRISVARAARFLRVVRLLRLLKNFPLAATPRLMLDGFLRSFWPLVWSIILIAFALYIFALLIVQSLTTFLSGLSGSPTDADMVAELLERFGSIERTMLTLFQAVTFGESWNIQYRLIQQVGWAAAAVYLFFIVLFSVVIWNLFTSVIVHRIADLAAPDLAEELNEKQKKQLDMEEMLLSAFTKMDKDLSGSISLDEFVKAMADEEFRGIFGKTGLDVEDVAFLFEALTAHTGGECLDIRDVVLGAMKLKGLSSSLDSFTVLQMVKQLGEDQRTFILFCMRRLQGITERLEAAEELNLKGSDAVGRVHMDIAALSRIDILL